MTNKKTTGSTASYSAQYKDPRWQKKRLEIMQRDGFKCRKCNSEDDTLNVHHCHYRKGAKIWEYDNIDLVTLCEKCHEYVHDQYDLLDRHLIPVKRKSAIQSYNDCELLDAGNLSIIISFIDDVCGSPHIEDSIVKTLLNMVSSLSQSFALGTACGSEGEDE